MSLRRAERILHGDRAVLLPVIQILCVQHLGASGFRDRDNQGIPERDLVAFLDIHRRQDVRTVDDNHREIQSAATTSRSSRRGIISFREPAA